jgi:hypothetical protein
MMTATVVLGTAVVLGGSAAAQVGERVGGWNPEWGGAAISRYQDGPYSTTSAWPFPYPNAPAYAYSTRPANRGTYQTRLRYAYIPAAPVVTGRSVASERNLVTGRSVASGSIGMHCATSVKTCMLRNASYIGGDCSCKVTGGRAHGSVTR